MLPDVLQMGSIAPRFDYPAPCIVKYAMGNNRQAGIGGDVAARLIQRQAGNVTENTV